MASIFESIPPLVIVKPIPVDVIPFVTASGRELDIKGIGELDGSSGKE